MKWHEIIIYTTEEATEAISDYLHSLSVGGVSIEESGSLNRSRDTSLGQWYEKPLNDIKEGETVVRAYFAEIRPIEEIAAGVRTFLTTLGSFGLDAGKAELDIATVDDEDWANAWKQYYKPVRVSDNIVVKPTWERYDEQPGDIVIELDPGMAFGTGTHPTTYLSLQLLQCYIKECGDCIDVGTGSGILAIAAAKLGAKCVVALDLDPVAVSSAKENVALNDLTDQVEVMQSDLLSIMSAGNEHPFQLVLPVQYIVANILADIIVTFVDDAYAVLQNDGIFIASGIIAAKESMTVAALQSAGFSISDIVREQEWVAIAAVKRQVF